MNEQTSGSHPTENSSFLNTLLYDTLQRLARDLEEGRVNKDDPIFHTPSAIAPPVDHRTSPPWEVTIPSNLKQIQHLLACDLTAEIVVQPKNAKTSPTYWRCHRTITPPHLNHPKNPMQGTQSQYNKKNPRSCNESYFHHYFSSFFPYTSVPISMFSLSSCDMSLTLSLPLSWIVTMSLTSLLLCHHL